MREVWERIEAAVRSVAPNPFPSLPPGAPPEAIAAAEERLGFQLPAELRESYAAHNGTGGADILPHTAFGLVGVPLLSLDDALRDREMWMGWRDGGSFEGRRAHPRGPIRAEWWSPRWLPVTWDGGGDHLCLDMDPAAGGRMGQVIYFSHEVGPIDVVARGWRAYLERYASDLEAGRLRFDAGGELVAAHPSEPGTAPDRC